jgi:hypothetical protein
MNRWHGMSGALLCAALAISGCSNKKDAAASPPAKEGATAPEPPKDPPKAAPVAAAPAVDPACQQQVASLHDWMMSLAAAGQPEIDFGTKLVEVDLPAGWVPVSDDAELTESFTGVWNSDEGAHSYVNGLAGPALAARLGETFAAHADDEQPGLRVDIDAKTPWSRVVELLDAAAKAGYPQAHLVFKAKPPMDPPPPSSVHDQLVAGHAVDLWERCHDVSSYYLNHGGGGTRARAEEEATAIPAAIASCACAVDFAAIRENMWSNHVGKGSFRAALTITLPAAGADATEVKLPAKTPWAKAAPKVLEAAKVGKPVRFSR